MANTRITKQLKKFTDGLFNVKPYQLGLTLSGGGAKCMAQIGLLQYLNEQGVEPDIVAGTSGGAMIGALHCAGYTPHEILDFFISTRMFSFRNLSFSTLGLIDSEKVMRSMVSYFPDDNFASLKKPLYVVATDLNRAKPAVFNSGPLIKALTASSAYPGMFTPVNWQGTVYADGGIINNFPTNIINDKCRHHIGMYLAPMKPKAVEHFANTFDVLDRVFHIYGSVQLANNIHLPEIALAPDGIENCRAFMVKPDQLKSIYEMGYNTCRKYFDNEGAQWLQARQGLNQQARWFNL